MRVLLAGCIRMFKTRREYVPVDSIAASMQRKVLNILIHPALLFVRFEGGLR